MKESDERPFSAAAKRMRRFRERRRHGMISMRIEIRSTEIDNLIGRGFLTSESRGNPNAVRKALYGFLDRELN